MGDQSPRPRLHISFFHPIRLCCMPSWRDACTGDSSSEMEESFCTRPPSPIPTALSSLIRFVTNRRWNFTQYYAVPYTLCTLLLHRRDVSWKQGDIGIKVIIDSRIALSWRFSWLRLSKIWANLLASTIVYFRFVIDDQNSSWRRRRTWRRENRSVMSNCRPIGVSTTTEQKTLLLFWEEEYIQYDKKSWCTWCFLLARPPPPPFFSLSTTRLS